MVEMVQLGQTAAGRYPRVVYVPDDEPKSVFVITVYELTDNALSVPPASKGETSMKQKFPEGWDESQVGQVLTHYDEQSEDDAVIEDEAGVRPSETLMSVPHELVPEVRELIARRKRER